MAESINDLLQKLPPTQESIDKIRETVIELNDSVRRCIPNTQSIKWMDEAHRKFTDNTFAMHERKRVLQKNIDQCNNRIKQIKLTLKK